MAHLQRIKRILLCMSLCFPFTAAATSFVTFANPDHRQEFSDREVISDTKIFRWSAAWPTDIRLEFISFAPLSLRLQCRVEKLSAGEELIQASFCFENRNPSLNKCVTLRPDRRTANLSLGDAAVRLEFDPQLGINASLNRVPAGVQLPPHAAACRLANRRGAVESNRVFVLDLRKYFPPAVNISDDDVTELNSRTATIFKCSEEELGIERFLNETDQPAVPLPFRWEICEGASLKECLLEKERQSVLSLAEFREWPVQIREEGDLYMPFVPSHVITQLQDKHLLCSLGRTPLAFYVEPFNFTENDDPASLASPASPLSALSEPRRVTLFNTSRYVLRLPCWVETSVPLSAVMWRFLGSGAAEDVVLTGEGRKMKGITVASDGSSLTFTGPFSSDIEGRYSCEVTAEGESVTSSYEVSVSKPPRVPASIPSEKLVVSGEKVNLTCKFEGAYDVVPSLEVCGKQLNLSSWASLDRSRAAINAQFKRVLLPLHFNVSAVKPQIRQEITYYSGRLQILPSPPLPPSPPPSPAGAKKKPLGNLHQVTCVGLAPPFRVRKTVLLKVLPAPDIKRAFPDKICRVKCLLGCNVRALSFYEQHGLKVEVRWTSKLVTAGAPGDWSQWERSGPTYLLQAADSVQRKRVKCEVRLLGNSSGNVLFSKATETAVLELSAEPWPPKKGASSRLPTVVTATVFAVIVVASVIYFVVYRWKHRQRQSA